MAGSGMATNSCLILYIIVSLALSRLVSSFSHPRLLIISVTGAMGW